MSAVALQACAPGALLPDDRSRVCHVAVEKSPDAIAFKANLLAGPVKGPLVGTVGGLLSVFPYGPLAVVVPVAGIACGIASATYPNAEADLRAVFESADHGELTRALGDEFTTRLTECRRVRQQESGADVPDTIVRIDKVEYQWNCLQDKQAYAIKVKWRALSADGSRVFADAITQCNHESSRKVDEWSADPSWARLEVARALAKTGKRVALEILDVERAMSCRYSPDDLAGASRK
jgi:hypothetical protein